MNNRKLGIVILVIALVTGPASYMFGGLVRFSLELLQVLMLVAGVVLII